MIQQHTENNKELIVFIGSRTCSSEIECSKIFCALKNKASAQDAVLNLKDKKSIVTCSFEVMNTPKIFSHFLEK